MLTPLFSPVATSRISTGFTTCPICELPSAVARVALSDKTLGVHRVTSSTTHNLVTPPITVPGGDGSSQAWEALYLRGSINPGNKTAPHGGFGFYMRGPAPFSDALKGLSPGDEVAFGYDVLFEEGFEWVKGGKLPGICESSARICRLWRIRSRFPCAQTGERGTMRTDARAEGRTTDACASTCA